MVLVSIRADYHKQYHLPSAPILRPHRAINFEAHNSNNPKAPMSIARLLNVHYGLPKPDKGNHLATCQHVLTHL